MRAISHHCPTTVVGQYCGANRPAHEKSPTQYLGAIRVFGVRHNRERQQPARFLSVEVAHIAQKPHGFRRQRPFSMLPLVNALRRHVQSPRQLCVSVTYRRRFVNQLI